MTGLPGRPSVPPIIMVGPGTVSHHFAASYGSARRVESQRAALGTLAMLFFGCRHPEQDCLWD